MKNQTETQNQKCIKEVAKEVAKFLKANGGYANGYGTFIEGFVTQRTYTSHKWNTPKSDELTGKKCRELSFELNNRLLKIIEKYNVEEVELVSKHIEDGCYKVYVVAKEEEVVDLWAK